MGRFGNQTKIPAADAGEHEITASFYVDNQITVQKQDGETTSYTYDPSGRTEKTVSEGTTKATMVNHYAGPGDAVSLTEEEEGKGWTRDIPGIDGALAATQHNSEAAVLQVHDLEGDIIGTAAVSETETKLRTTYNPTEFGVPVNGAPPTEFSWLGAGGLATEQASGAANLGGGSYVPQLGAVLQTAPITPPGDFGHGSYNGAVFTPAPSSEALAQLDSYGAGAPVREAERLQAQREEAEKHAYEAECHLGSCQVYGPEGGDPECYLKVVVGATVSSTGTEWVYARGWGWCQSTNLPKTSWLKVCLGIEGELGYGESFCEQVNLGGSVPAGHGEANPSQLYAHEHVQCEKGSRIVRRRFSGRLVSKKPSALLR